MRIGIRDGFIGLLLQLVVVPHAFCATLEEGVQAIDNGDFVTAFKTFETAAEAGDREAQYNLALMYKQGKGTLQDITKAAKWMRLSADQGLPEAQFYLGYLYDEGEGVVQSYEYAALWYRKAAEHGSGLAQSNLGLFYANGQGVKQDLLLAYVWMHLAAAQGVATAVENRDMVAKELSPEMLENAKKGLVKEFFTRYVAPFQSQHVDMYRRRRDAPPESK